MHCLIPALLVSALAAAPATRTWVQLQSTGRTGVLTAVTHGASVDLDWKVDNNGRGPKIVEHLTLDPRGYVVSRELAGTGEAGAPVKESFSWDHGQAKWVTLDDRGEAATAAPVYLDVAGAPWILGHYVQLANKLKVKTLPALPSGTLTIERLKDLDLGSKDPVSVYALGGLGFEPILVVMRGEAFVGVLDPGEVLIEDRYAHRFSELSAIARDLQAVLERKRAKELTHHVDAPLWLTNVHVFDSLTGKVGEAAVSVVVFQGVITGVRTDGPPPGALVIDGQGGTLLPGLFDSHGHQSAGDGLLDLAAGVTFSRDPGNDNDTLLALTRKFDSGEFIGPRVWKSGFLEGKSPFSASGGFTVATLEEGLEKVRWYADHGFWGLKLYNSMNPAFVQPLAAEAHRLGLHVSGHVPAFMTSEQSVRAGYDEVNHINQLLLGFLLEEGEDTRTPFRFTVLGERLAGFDLQGPAFRAMIALMKERGTTLDPTMAIFSGLMLSRPGHGNPTDANFLEHVPAPVKRARSTAILDVPPALSATYEASWKKLEQTLVLLHDAGIPLVPGTDDVGGLVLHSELEAWVKAGIPPGDVLRAATSGAAKFLGQERNLGVIARGRVADLYLVEGDPTKDISQVRKGRLVMKGESIFFPDELYAAAGVRPFAGHAPIAGAK